MCDPCCPSPCPPICCPMPCEPCCPPSCCPSPCDPCCPPSCGPCCPPPCEPKCCPTPCCPPACPPKRCRSRELRGGNLLTSCDCVKRNGLQLDCPRTECKGRPMCSTKPFPICCPSKYTWRYSNVTMGKPSFPSTPKQCPKKSTCSPCGVICFTPC